MPALRDYVGEDREQMKQAVIKEMRDLCSLGTLSWEKIPDNRRAISSKVVLKLKYKADGTTDKHKGRLVARGFESKPGVDFFGTFAPMANLATVRTLFAIAVHTIGSDGKSLPIIQADIPQAFLQAEIDVPQYIMLPKGITVNPVYTALDTAEQRIRNALSSELTSAHQRSRILGSEPPKNPNQGQLSQHTNDQ